MSDLPPGFVLDKKPAAAPALPPGFVLDKPRAAGGFFESLWSGITSPDTAKKAVGGISEGAANLVSGLWDSLSAGTQGVSRYATDKAKLAPQQAQNIFEESGSVQDARTQFVARNPQTGKMSVYIRSPDVETSRLGGAMDVIGTQMSLAQPESFGATVVPKTAMTPATRLAQEFKQEGIRPNLPAVMGEATASRAAQLGGVVPIVGGPIRGGIERTLEDTAKAVERRTAAIGTAREGPEAGASAQNALKAYAADKSQAASDYKEFDRLMHGAPPIQMPRTIKLLADLQGRFPTNEGLAGIFTNPKLMKLHDLLSPRTENIPAQTSQMLDQFGRPAVTRPAQTVMRGGQLTMPELKELRSQVGYLLETPQFGPDQIPRAQLRQLYAGLTQDLEGGAAARGPQALKAFRQATLNYGTRMRVLDRLDGLINNPNADAVFARLNAATQQNSSDFQLLQMAQKAMPKEEWGNLGASILHKMGKPTPGARDALSVAPDFSLSSFSTNWNKLSSRAKDLLFGSDEVGSQRAGLERLARIVQSQKNVAAFANRSRSGEMMVMRDIMGFLGGGAGMAAPVTTAIGVGAGWGVAKAIMSPKFVNMIFKPPSEIVRPSQAAGQAAQTLGRGAAALEATAQSEKLRRQEEVAAPAGVR